MNLLVSMVELSDISIGSAVTSSVLAFLLFFRGFLAGWRDTAFGPPSLFANLLLIFFLVSSAWASALSCS